MSGRIKLVRLRLAGGGRDASGTIKITENTEEGNPLDISRYAWAEVDVQSEGGEQQLETMTFSEYQTAVNNGSIRTGTTYYVEL